MDKKPDQEEPLLILNEAVIKEELDVEEVMELEIKVEIYKQIF